MHSKNPLLTQRFLILLIGLFLCSGSVLAQNATIQGMITDKATGQPLYGANVVLESLANDVILGASADSEGFYSLSSIEPGTWIVRISFIGYVAEEDTITLESGENRSINGSLRPDEAMMDELVVEGATGAVMRDEGRQRITPSDLTRIPSPATGDLVTYLQTLPGVVAMGDRGGQFFIRGGEPSQNLALVDGAVIYKPAHIVGFYSPFPESIVSGADFYAGGFGPRYTGRISSVLDIQMRHGDRRSFKGAGSVSPFAAEVMAEGPLTEGESSFIFSVRNSLIEEVSTWYPIENQPLNFQSQFLKTSYIDQNTRCSAMFMHTYDRGRMDFEEPESIKWRNIILGGKCVALPEGSRALMDTNISLSHFSNKVTESEPFGFSSRVFGLNVDLNLRQYIGDIRFDYGLITRLNYLNYDIGEKFVGIQGDKYTELILGTYVETAIPLGDKFTLQPGTALSFNPQGYGLSLEPRFRFSLLPFGSEEQEISGSLGLYKQSIVGISDMRDISSVFVAWAGSPLGAKQVKAVHALLGWQQEIFRGFSWSVEGYYKTMTDIAVPVWSTIARFTTDLALADGKAYGADIRVEYNRGRFYALAGYGISQTVYTSSQDHFNVWFGEEIQKYNPPHDRRHQVNLLFSADLGGFTMGSRWQLGTGLPYTRPLGFDDLLDFRERLPDVTSDRGIQRVILDKPYQGRMPVVHRLDVSVEKRFQITNSGTALNLQIGAINSYDQTNIFYYDVFTRRRIDQLPFLPYATLELEID
ncbi:TonB-dependent receptor [Rhodohalobacter sp. 8-1]|uniref:TonB-dependent receptor n=1 Tax=Rhodohalobacter sp. 8-1 TaxID=3131972 RepID=UPI0030EE6CF1